MRIHELRVFILSKVRADGKQSLTMMKVEFWKWEKKITK